MNKLFAYIAASFDTHKQGASARKLSAFVTMVLICFCHRWVDASNVVEILIADSGLLCVLLGITTYEKIKLNQPQPNQPTE
jgi:hypothetical protein